MTDTLERPDTPKKDAKPLRERYRLSGLGGLRSHESLELVLSYANPGKDTKPLSKALLERFKCLRGVFDATAEELMSVEGVGENAAVLVRLIKEVSGFYLRERMTGKDIAQNPGDALDYLNLTLSGERVEKFLALYLNGKNEVIAIETLHEGTINQTVVYPRKAIEKAFRHNARAVIFVHNHPSGDATPSRLDRELASVLDRAAAAVGLAVCDHLIIGKNNHFSARENGWISGAAPRAAEASPG